MKTEDIKNIIEPILESHGVFLVELKISKENAIGISVDAMQGVNIQTCMAISREIEEHLDRETEDFELTVSSAGIGYPFKVEGQYHKNLGKKVEIRLRDNTKLAGTMTAFDANQVSIEYEEKKIIEGSKKKQLVKIEKNVPRKEIKEIRDVVEF